MGKQLCSFVGVNSGKTDIRLAKATLYQKSRNPEKENSNLLSITVLYPKENHRYRKIHKMI